MQETAMLLQHNEDRNDESYNTKAPFRYECELALPEGSLPAQSIRSLIVYCEDGIRPPVRLASVSIAHNEVANLVLEFTDFAGNLVGTANMYQTLQTPYATTFIYSANGVIKGHVCYNAEAANALADAARLSAGSFKTKESDFMLLPQCHVAWLSGHARALSVNGKATRRNVIINPTIEMHTDITSVSVPDSSQQVDCYVLSMAAHWTGGGVSIITNPAMNGLCKLAMNNVLTVDGATAADPDYLLADPVYIGGAHLVIRSSDTSNLRVISNGRAISVMGVQDV